VRIIFADDVNGQPDILGNYEVLERTPRLWSLRVHGELGGLVQALAGLPIRDLEVEEPHVEDALMQYYRGGPS
jgi:hypothetical protein